MKTIKYLGLVTVIALIGVIAFMGIYTPTATYPGTHTPAWTGGITRFSGTFVTATDTFYCVFPAPRPKSGTDTTVAALTLISAPYTTSSTGDTSNIYWGIQWTNGDANGVTTSATWSTLTQIGIDSTAAGATAVRTVILSSYTATGIHPYYRIVVIGKTPSGGKANDIGSTFVADFVRQYSY